MECRDKEMAKAMGNAISAESIYIVGKRIRASAAARATRHTVGKARSWRDCDLFESSIPLYYVYLTQKHAQQNPFSFLRLEINSTGPVVG